MKDYTVALLDSEGFEITSQWAGTLAEAKKAAKYLISDAYAESAGTNRKAMNADKVEVTVDGECVWDVFA
jgi:hypothetical protein